MWHSWKFRHEQISEYISINKFTRTHVRINIYIENCTNIQIHIFEYSSNLYTLTHSWMNVRIHSYKQIWHKWMSEYIHIRKIDTNECPNKYLWPKYLNIRIYSSQSAPNQVPKVCLDLTQKGLCFLIYEAFEAIWMHFNSDM